MFVPFEKRGANERGRHDIRRVLAEIMCSGLPGKRVSPSTGLTNGRKQSLGNMLRIGFPIGLSQIFGAKESYQKQRERLRIFRSWHPEQAAHINHRATPELQRH